MSNEQSTKKTINRIVPKIALAIFDIIAVNAAYLLALYVRFYVHGQFDEMAMIYYLPALRTFAPYYTIACIAVFAYFRLYSSLWRYAGIRDLNRLVVANVITFLIQVAGSVMFVQRMPITYYVIGGFIQVVLLFVSRFSFRFFAMEGSQIPKDKQDSAVNVMVVGIGDSAKMFLRQLARRGKNVMNPVCVIDYRGHNEGYLFDGFPVIATLEGMRKGIEKYNVKSVVIADSLMPSEVREKIRSLCDELNVDIQDFSGYNQGFTEDISLLKLMECVNGPVQIIMNEIPLDYENGEAAVMALHDKYIVKNVSADKGKLVIEVERDKTVRNNINDTWMNVYENQTGDQFNNIF
ncbi:MAG: hypothetical protein K6F23_11715 [Solobacterium sp.]|nr:hypothetical protein [Solobacterium sp.]